MRINSTEENIRAVPLQEEPAATTHGGLLEAGLRRDQHWRELRRKSLKAELDSLQRLPNLAAAGVASVLATEYFWREYLAATLAGYPLSLGNALGLVWSVGMLGGLAGIATRFMLGSVVGSLRGHILRRARNEGVNLPE